MLWLGIRCLDLPLAALAADRAPDHPLAVLERQRIWVCNAAAAAVGVVADQPVASALALCPGLQVRHRDPARETAALAALGMACHNFTPRVALRPPAALLLEIGGSLRLFGGPAALLARLRAMLDLHHLSAALGAAANPAAALLLTHADRDPLDYLEHRGEIRHPVFTGLLDSLPLAALDCPPRVREALAQAGLHNLGALLELPGRTLGRRYGRDLVHYLQRIQGRRPDPQPSLVLPPEFQRTLELGLGVEAAEMLLFPARRLLQELSGYLRARQFCCGSLHWRLTLADGTTTELPLRLSRPRGDLQHLLELTRLGFAGLLLPAPVTALGLGCRDLHPLAGPQPDLLGAPDPAADTSAFQALCDRLGARLGPEAIRRPLACDEHLPERAGSLAPAGFAGHSEPPPPQAQRPLWLLESPQPLAVQGRRPCLAGDPLALENGPERIESHWWCTPASRDYYQARSSHGRRCWVYRDRRSGTWFLHGLFG
jgi:protein ImuB